MLILWLSIMAAVAAGVFLLALVSDGFAYELSRVVEAIFDRVEYRLALSERRRSKRQPVERVVYEASYADAH